MKNAHTQIAEFINSGKRNEWLHRPWGKVYVRNAHHVLYPGVLSPTFDVAAVEADAKWRGHGCFTRWLRRAESACLEHLKTIYIENVMEDRFREFFLRNDYTLAVGSADFCFFKEFAAIREAAKVRAALVDIQQLVARNE